MGGVFVILSSPFSVIVSTFSFLGFSFTDILTVDSVRSESRQLEAILYKFIY